MLEEEERVTKDRAECKSHAWMYSEWPRANALTSWCLLWQRHPCFLFSPSSTTTFSSSSSSSSSSGGPEQSLSSGGMARCVRLSLFHQALLLALIHSVLIASTEGDLGVYSDSEDQRLTIRISALPTDSGFPYALYRQVQLRCEIDTEPAIDIGSCGWRFNHGADFLENNNKYTLYVHPSRGTVHSLTMTLTINGVTEQELGYYTCEGKNSAGLKKTATVEVVLVDEDTVGIKDARFLKSTTDPLDDFDPPTDMDGNALSTTTEGNEIGMTDIDSSVASSIRAKTKGTHGRLVSFLLLLNALLLYLNYY